MKKIIIDARHYGPEHTGIGRYVKGLLENLPRSPEIELAVITHSRYANERPLFRYRIILSDHHPYSLLSQIHLAKILLLERPDLLHVPHFTVPLLWHGMTIVTIHDLIKHESVGPKTTTRNSAAYRIKHQGYKAIMNLAVTRSVHVITPSNYWKLKLMEKFHLPAAKVSVTYEGVDKIFYNPGLSTLNSQLSTPYIVYVGNVYPHKNVTTLIQAAKLLNGKIHLYISCARNVFWDRTQKMISQLGARGCVTHLGFVPDSELATLYHNSLSYVTASKIEGLGLPGLEAMAAGTAVISSNSSCLPEIYGDAALYFDPDKPEELAEKVSQLLKNNNLRQKLIKKGKIQVSKYSWQKMADQTWEIYKKHLAVSS